TIQEISDEIGIPKEEIAAALEASYHPEYLESVIHQDDGAPLYLIDKISAEDDEHEDMIDNIFLKEILSKLSRRGRQVIMLSYFKDRSEEHTSELQSRFELE